MTLKLYDTLTQQKLEFRPMIEGHVKMFVCGPTIYDYSHIGHARTYLVFDMLARYLRFKGYTVFYLENITDIDDRIIERANREQVPAKSISDKYKEAFLEDIKKLDIDSIDLYAPATNYIAEIIAQIQVLISRGYAYETDDGVYFDISKFPEYGKLSHQTITSLMAGSRVEINELKKNPLDFALWKKRKPGEPYWSSPWGEGRPGWHIEDTAITEHYLGTQYDLHGGGSDLIFPHHECEIAQMEAASGKKPMVRYWMHTGLLTIEDRRMGKSMGNAINIRDILKIVRKEVLRFYIFSSHYHSPLNYSIQSVEESKNSWERIVSVYFTLKSMSKFSSEPNAELAGQLEKFNVEFTEAMDDDLNTPKAISVIMNLISWVYKNMNMLTQNDVVALMQEFENIDSIFRILPRYSVETESLVRLVLELRDRLRKDKNYELSDYIRSELKKQGITVQDTGSGIIWYFS
ncbi:MAG: cysteine--tRNA ligase [Thermoplasmata archaeon]